MKPMKNKTVKTIIMLGTLVTTSLHVLNRIQFSHLQKHKLLVEKEHLEYEWRFGKISYRRTGCGNPILVVHDLTVGSSSYEYHRIIDELSKTNEVFSIDLLGYGLSEKPDITYTNYLYVQLLIDFIKNVIGKKTDIIATGDSAPIAVMACHNDPEVFNRLIFINPQNLFRLNQIPSKQTKILKLLIESPILGTFVYNILTMPHIIEEDFYHKYFCNPMKVKEKYILSWLEAAHLPDYRAKHVFASYTGKYMNANIIHALKEINHSIYIIAGEEKEDNQTIIENYEYYNTSIETAYIPKTKQLPHLEKPEEVLSQLQLFLH